MSDNFAQCFGLNLIKAILPLNSLRARRLLFAAVWIVLSIAVDAPDCAAQSGAPTAQKIDQPPNRGGAAQTATAEQKAEIRRLTALIETEPNKTENYIERGKIYRTLKQLEAALADFARAIELAPSKASAYYWRAWTYQELGQNDCAILDFNKIVELEPDKAESYNSRAWAYEAAGELGKAAADRSQRDRILKQDKQTEVNELTLAIEREPGKTENYRRRAEIYLRFEQNATAIADFDQILKLEPDDDWIRAQRAHQLAESKQFDRALADYDFLIKRDSGGSRYRRSRAVIYLQTKQFQRAVADFSQALKTASATSDYSIYLFRADAYEALHNLPLAVRDRVRAAEIYRTTDERDIRDLTERIKSNPRDAELYQMRGVSYEVRGRHAQAIADYTRAVGLAPADYSSYAHRAAAYEALGDLQKARADKEKVRELLPLPGVVQPSIQELGEQIRQQPNDAKLYLARGSARFENKQFAAAVDDFARALELDQKLSNFVLYLRAESFLNLKRYPEAISDYTVLLAVATDVAADPIFSASTKNNYYIKRGSAYLQSNQFDQAIADFTRIVAAKPNDADGYRLRAPAYTKARRFRLAIADYSKLISINPSDYAAYLNRAAVRKQAGEFAKAAADQEVAARINKP